MKVVDFRTSGYFSWTIIFLGIVLVFAGLFVAGTNLIVSLILFLVAAIIFTTHYRLAIDLDKKVYHDYLWILGLKNGAKAKFEKIEYLFINSSKVSQTMNHMVLSSTLRKEVYGGYLKFSEKDKVHLTTRDSKARLVEKLKGISTQLKVRIIDYSEGDPKEI